MLHKIIDRSGIVRSFGSRSLLRAYQARLRQEAKAVEEVAHAMPVDAPWAGRNMLLEVAGRAWRSSLSLSV